MCAIILTMANCTDLEQVITRTCNLYYENGSYIFMTEGQEHVNSFTKEELACLDHRLPDMAEYLVNRYSVNHVLAIRLTLEHWRNPGKPVHYNDFTCIRGVQSIYRVDEGSGPPKYKIRGFSYSLESIDDGIDYTGRGGLDIWYTADITWFEQHYPGLVERVDALLAMGADHEEASALALQEYPLTRLNASLAGVTFD